jgi:hypothetical protein
VGLRTLKGDDINCLGLVDEDLKREKESLNYKTFYQHQAKESKMELMEPKNEK